MKPGRWSPSRTRGKTLRSCHESPAAPTIASRANAGSRPARWPAPRASAVAAAMTATSRLLTSLATRPSPTGPQWMRRAGSPMASRAGAARSSAPGVAAAHDGQRPGLGPRLARRSPGSRGRRRRARAQSAASSRATDGAIVLISTSTGGGAAAASSPATTSRTSCESVTQEQPRSAPSAASATEAAERGGEVSRARGRTGVERRTSWPAAARLRIIPEPIRPAPTKPIRTGPRYRREGGRRDEGRPDARPRYRGSDAQEARDAVPERLEPPNCRAGAVGRPSGAA